MPSTDAAPAKLGFGCAGHGVIRIGSNRGGFGHERQSGSNRMPITGPGPYAGPKRRGDTAAAGQALEADRDQADGLRPQAGDFEVLGPDSQFVFPADRARSDSIASIGSHPNCQL